MNYKCTNCKWEGDESTNHINGNLNNKCPMCGDEVISLIVKEEPKKKLFNMPIIKKTKRGKR